MLLFLLIHSPPTPVNPTDACFSAFFSMFFFFVGHTVLPFSHMSLLNFLMETNAAHIGWKIHKKNKTSTSLIFLCVFVDKACYSLHLCAWHNTSRSIYNIQYKHKVLSSCIYDLLCPVVHFLEKFVRPKCNVRSKGDRYKSRTTVEHKEKHLIFSVDFDCSIRAT